MDAEGHNRFRKRVWAVAASGFLTTSYCIFSTNVVGPALQYVYPNCNSYGNPFLAINLTTLAGTAIGMVLFGFFADRYGRRALYGGTYPNANLAPVSRESRRDDTIVYA